MSFASPGKVDRTIAATSFVVEYSDAWCVLETEEKVKLWPGDELEADWRAIGPQQIVIRSRDARRLPGRETFAGNIADTECPRDHAIKIARDRVIIRRQLPPLR